jgi:hypothetical protein
MARILFKGSTHFAGVEHGALLRAAESLGYVGAERDHVLLVGSESVNTIDYHVKAGADQFCKAFPGRRARLEVHRPDDGKAPFTKLAPPNLAIDRRVYAVSTTSHSSENDLNWVVAHVGALDASDVLVLLGGGDGTELAGRVAIERQWPIVPIASFGGAARTLYNILGYELRRQPLISEKLYLLNGPWQDDSAPQIVELIESLVTRAAPHSYFISYSHADAAVADRVEVLLRREKRGVLRDERLIAPGEGLDASITTRIAMATTFLALHSQTYARSEYCSGELAVAHELKRSGNKPVRIVALRLDDTILSPLLAANVWLKVSDRLALDAAMQQILAKENGHS